MADWFAKLMQRGGNQARIRSVTIGAQAESEGVENRPPAEPRDARYDAIVQTLRDREAEDRDAREKRQRWYRQSLESDTDNTDTESHPESPVRLYKFSTKAPCRVTPEAQVLLEQLRRRFSGCTVSFQQAIGARQAVMVTGGGGAGTERKQIGWVEHYVDTNPRRCNARNQGLTVETDGESMLVVRFRYPSTGVQVTSKADGERGTGNDIPSAVPCASSAVPRSPSAVINFTEIRAALDQRPSEKSSSPRLVWLTRPELDAIKDLASRDYEAFYVRFKLELQAGIWSSLSGLLATAPGSEWHRGVCYTVVTEPDAAMRKIHQRTVDDSGASVDIGLDRIYDAAPATDILLLYLEGDILADLADIYFTLQSLNSSDAYFLKEEFFTIIRRFWASSQSLASRYGSNLAAIMRMSQRAMPMPAQAPLLKQDWTNLRQSLVDRYGKGGRNAADLLFQNIYRPAVGPLAWPFSQFPPGEINFGLRFVYRQEWRQLGTQRGERIRTVPETASSSSQRATRVETTIEQNENVKNLGELVDDIAQSTVDAMKWPRDVDGSIHTGVRALSVMTDAGLESESRESSRDVSSRLSDIAGRLAENSEWGTGNGSPSAVHRSPSTDPNSPFPEDATYVYSRLQNRYEVLTRPAEIQNVVLVAEKLPAPAEIDLSWVRRHDWILSRILLDESFRDALNTIHKETPSPDSTTRVQNDDEREKFYGRRDRFYEHVRANILHYQRAIWREEDPQQRSMRYRKLGKKVPLEWRFELELGAGAALTIEDFGDRLSATNVDAQFAAYSGGREADLDQLIDPAGPVGYYGNYAIYRMRPEYGADDFFSMLHFFKSPYLRPSAETGLPEVEDPAQIQLAQDPTVAGASDELIGQHHEDMLEYVPELERELAQSGLKPVDQRMRGAAAQQSERTSISRRHFAAYLFRRERARRLVLDTDGVVIDIIRSTSESEGAEQSGLIEGYDIVLHSEGEFDLLRVSVPNEAEWLGPQTDELTPSSLRAGRAADLENGWILPRKDGEQSLGASAPDHNDSNDEPVIFAQLDDGQEALSLGEQRAHHPVAQPGIVAHSQPASALHAGRALDSETSLIVARADRELSVRAAAGAPASEHRTIAAQENEEETSAETAADQAPAPVPELLIRARGITEETIALRVGRRLEAEPTILARNDEDQTIWIDNGRALDLKAEPGIQPQVDGEWSSTLLVSRAHDPNGDAGILGHDEEALRLTAVDGGKAAHPHEKAILAGGDDEWMTSLLAGAGVDRISERFILAQEDEWLRPSLVAS